MKEDRVTYRQIPVGQLREHPQNPITLFEYIAGDPGVLEFRRGRG